MPELKCPVVDFTARGASLSDAAMALSRHLVAQHCDTTPAEGADPSSSADLIGDVSLEGIDANVAVRGNIEVDPGRIGQGRQG